MRDQFDLKGLTPDSWACIDCGINTAPGMPSRVEMERRYRTWTAINKLSGENPPVAEFTVDEHYEVYTVRDSVWKRAGMEPWNGCLCVGCLEKRLGRRLKPKDFNWNDPINQLPGSARLTKRRGRR